MISRSPLISNMMCLASSSSVPESLCEAPPALLAGGWLESPAASAVLAGAPDVLTVALAGDGVVALAGGEAAALAGDGVVNLAGGGVPGFRAGRDAFGFSPDFVRLTAAAESVFGSAATRAKSCKNEMVWSTCVPATISAARTSTVSPSTMPTHVIIKLRKFICTTEQSREGRSNDQAERSLAKPRDAIAARRTLRLRSHDCVHVSADFKSSSLKSPRAKPVWRDTAPNSS